MEDPNTVNEHNDNEPLPPALLDELMGGMAPLLPTLARAAALRARVMSSLKGAAQESSELALAVAAVRSISSMAEQRWEKRWPGIELCVLRETPDSRSYLMRMQAGSTLPAHIHDQDEVSMIVEGEAWVGDTQLMGPGDFQFMPAGVSHATIRSPGGCIAFIHGQHGFRPRITPGFVARFIQYKIQRWSRGT